MTINTNINENYLNPNFTLTHPEVYRTTRSRAVKDKPFTPNMKVKKQPILIASDYYPDTKGSSGIEYRNSMKLDFPKFSPYSQNFKPF